jgi:hypothetical protein
MLEVYMKRLLKVTVLLGLVTGAAGLALAGQARDPDAASVREAVRYERAKEAAAARQAQRQSGRAETAVAATEGNGRGDGGVQEAVRFEHFKEAAAARQAKRDARQGGDATRITSTRK